MGLTKQYLRYSPYGVFNVIGSQKSNIIYLEYKNIKGKLCAVGACEHVFIWDLRKGEKLVTLEGDKHEVTRLTKCPDNQHLAVGYSDGAIRIFNIGSGECTVTFNGHTSAVTCLNYDKDGVRLVSGSMDTEVIVWDIVNESGLFRLRGHKGAVTQARFMKERNFLVSSSKDTLVKFWDLDTQHCFKTLVGHRAEVWDFALFNDDTRIITGSSDSELRVWKITYNDQNLKNEDSDDTPASPKRIKLTETESEDGEENEDEDDVIVCTKLGSIMRKGKDKVAAITTDSTGRFFGCHGSDSILETFRICTEDEIKKHLQKRQKKARKRARESGTEEVMSSTNALEDEIKRLALLKVGGRIRAFDCYKDGEQAKVLTLLNKNTIESHSVDISDKKSETTAMSKIMMPGHRSDIRTLSFSSDGTAVLSGSGDAVKIWNREKLQCIRTIESEYALCSLFAPGDRHVVIGTKSGKLQLFDLAAGALIESYDAHKGAVWSICLAPDKRGFVSGSADHEVKFWDFELITDEKYSKTSKRLTIVHTRTLKMSDDVLCVKYSPDQKLVAVSLLDNTVKVFFADTLKFFLSLYGHKLPVLCMDISTDGKLLVTGSADRNVKLWGLDFGDCHKSIFAHDDSIMCVQFVPKTHMFFTGGKDKMVKEWDGDNFEQIQTLKGHHGEVWCMAVSPSGNYLVTGSHDKSLRIWEKSQEPLVLEEEKEMEREKEYEESVAQGDQPVVPGETDKEAGIAGKKTIETVKAAERIMEAIELYKDETEKLNQYEADCKAAKKKLPTPTLHPMFEAFKVNTPTKYMLEVLKKVRSSELEESLLVLPFSYVIDLLNLLNTFLVSEWEVELSCRCLFFLLRIHQGQITSNQVLLPIIDHLRSNAAKTVNKLRDTIGFNLAGLKFIQQQFEEKEQVTFFADATDRFKEKKKKKKAILSIKA